MPTQARDEKGLRQAESLWLDSLNRKDAAALECVLGEKFVDTTWQGQIHDRAQAIAGLSNRPSVDQKVEVGDIRILGHTGLVWGVNLIRDAKSHQILMRIRFTDVFRYEDGHWVAVAAQETPEKSSDLSPGSCN